MEQAAITFTMISSLALTLSLVVLLVVLISLIFFLNKYDQESGLMGGNWMKKVYKKSQSFVETIESEKEKQSVYRRLKLIRIMLRVLLVSLILVGISIVFWVMVP